MHRRYPFIDGWPVVASGAMIEYKGVLFTASALGTSRSTPSWSVRASWRPQDALPVQVRFSNGGSALLLNVQGK